MFSPPQTSRPGSYVPSSKKYFLSIENNPPAITGHLMIETEICWVRCNYWFRKLISCLSILCTLQVACKHKAFCFVGKCRLCYCRTYSKCLKYHRHFTWIYIKVPLLAAMWNKIISGLGVPPALNTKVNMGLLEKSAYGMNRFYCHLKAPETDSEYKYMYCM